MKSPSAKKAFETNTGSKTSSARSVRPNRTPFRKGSAADLFPIVGVGASAGGLEAFTQLLRHLPGDTGLGFVLVQHLDPKHESALTQLLARGASMPVREVTNNMRVERNHIYVIPPNTNLGIVRGVLKLLPVEKQRSPVHSIDAFFKSLAEDQRERAIGVVLSGTATDGTVGLEAIKAEGGITFAQDDSARYDSMPRNAVAAGCVDFVLNPEDIAKELVRIAKHPYFEGRPLEPAPKTEGPTTTARDGGDQSALPSKQKGVGDSQGKRLPVRGEKARGETEENGFKRILLLLRNHSGVDFSLYKSTTIQRRITRRMVLNKQNTLEDYAAFIQGNAKELDALYSDVLISVTSFFRNPEAFEFLKRKIFPALLQRRSDDPVRVWVLGCSTGQEAYSIAMAFMESAVNAPQMRKLQVFATDLNNTLLDKARHGLYTKNLAEDVSPERLRRFFVEEEGGYRVIKSLREMVVFARQNLISDPPFSRMDLISCRNLLIYLEPELQKKALPMFHYALKPGGALFLGASESIGNLTDLFAPVDKKHKIYFKKAAPTPAFHPAYKTESEGQSSSRRRPALPVIQPTAEPPPGLRGELNVQREADRVMVNQFAPPAVLINDGLQILQFRGPTSAYLEPPTGKASFDVLKMAREGLMLPLRATINKARKENKTARRENVTVKQNGGSRKVNLEVIPLKNLRERCFLILFEDLEKAERAVPGASPQPPSRQPSRPLGKREESRIAGLESELSETRDYVQSIQEQHEAANEELQASNEEVQSANEELQSINEELETSKEELESANEELTTVNEEMASRNAELSQLNAELNNLHASVNLPILVLARDLTVRRFTAPAERIFNLLATDVGRPLSVLRHNLEFETRGQDSTPQGHNAPRSLEALIREVIDTVSVREQEVRDKDGRWFVLRARPYLTLDNKIDGAVVVLVDITELKRTEREIQAAREYAEAVIRTVRDPLVVLRPDLRVNTANKAFYEMFETTANETEGRLIYDLGGRQWQLPELRPLLEGILSREKSFENFEVTRDFPETGRRALLFSARRLEQQDGSPPMILLAVEEVTERRRATAATALLASIVNSSDDAIIGKDLDGIITSWNQGAERLFGYTAKEAVGQPITMLMPPDRQAEEREILERLKRGQPVEHFETVRLRKDGSRVEISLTSSPIKDAAGQIIGSSKIAHNITERRRAERDLAERARLIDLSNDAIIARGIDDKISLWNQGAEKLYGWTSKEAMGQKLDALLHTEFPKPMEEIVAQFHREGKFSGEVVQTARDGRRIQSLCRWVLDRETQSILTSYTDISEFRRVEEALRKSESWQRLILETAQDFAIFSTDEQGRVTDWKAGAEQIFGYSSGEIIGLNASILFTPEDRAAGIPEQNMQTAANENRAADERWHVRKGGGLFFASGVMRPLRDDSGMLMGFLKVARDITQRRQNEETLGEARAVLADQASHLGKLVAERTTELMATNRQLEAFVYSIAHDLRAPLRAMQGFSTMLVEEEGPSLSDAGREYARIISNSAQYMDALLRDLLAFSRISQQRVELTPVKLDALVEAVLSRLQKDIQESNARVESVGPWPIALAHEPTLSQVLINLITNALKFAAPEVPPVVRLRTEEREEFIRVWVEDNGIGIDPDHQEQIFRLFTRLHGERYQGTGIGLAIVQKGVERMGGHVGVESVRGQGSRFWFELQKGPSLRRHPSSSA